MSKLTGLGGRLYSGETSFDIIGKRRRWYSISAIFILLSIAALVIQGLHLGIEFKGGSSYTVNKSGISVEQARSSVAGAG
ncbi:MAG: protein translocase subunit SecF, partial [Actinobacteria bacterium]|nr:protein translocase subunit SecF [Actinomycetota bacterium]